MKRRIELRSLLYHSVEITDNFDALEMSQPEGEVEEVGGIQVKFNRYPTDKEPRPRPTVFLLPAGEALAVASEIMKFIEERTRPIGSGRKE